MAACAGVVVAACSKPARSEIGPPTAWHVVHGTVVDAEGDGVANGYVRSVASSESDCDEHAHSGAADPEIARTSATGAYRQVVLAADDAFCVRVTAHTADSLRSGSATAAGRRLRPRSEPADSVRVNIVAR